MRAMGWAALILAGALAAAGCQRQVASGIPSPIESRWRDAEAAFRTGDYVQAAAAYGGILNALRTSDNGALVQRERVLFRLGVVYALPGSPIQDGLESRRYLTALLDEFPETELSTEVHLILGLQSELQELTAEGRRQADLIERLASEVGSIDAARQRDSEQAAHWTVEALRLQEESAELRMETERLRLEADRLRADLRRLTVELERLKEIDLGRQPPR